MASYLIVFNNNLRKERVFRDRQNPLEVYNDEECVQRFRFDRQTIADICLLLYDDLKRPTSRTQSMPVVIIVCAALRFYSQGAFFRATGDCINISKSSMSRIVYQVSQALSQKVDQFIKFPKNAQLITETKQEFYAIKNFPNVIGAIDCTHVEILAPHKAIEANYVNRKNYHSINLQAICNASLEFINVVVKYPGRVHDAFIWEGSAIKSYFQNNTINGWLLGDSGYPLENNLMTPFMSPSNSRQENYNRAHCATRNSIERAFGVLKMRFRCLDKTAGKLMFEPSRACKIITSCLILHNISRSRNFFGEQFNLGSNNEENNPEANADHHQQELGQGRLIRLTIVEENFQ
jgi:hypothetical protein